MPRTGEITFKGTPMSLVGSKLGVGSSAPDFVLHYFDGGLKSLTKSDLLGKPTIISIVPSLDTGVCQIQTKRFNSELAALGGSITGVTVSRDLPFAQNRFCGAEEVKNMRVGSDYQNGSFGEAWGVLIDELKLLARAVYVLDPKGIVTYAEIVPEVTHEPNYDAALAALKDCGP
ncbi:MAG: thiol peroxidase [Planctomycetales bacterium]|nr:thiol peroxidase [Planctomycetales bacterium]